MSTCNTECYGADNKQQIAQETLGKMIQDECFPEPTPCLQVLKNPNHGHGADAMLCVLSQLVQLLQRLSFLCPARCGALAASWHKECCKNAGHIACLDCARHLCGLATCFPVRAFYISCSSTNADSKASGDSDRFQASTKSTKGTLSSRR